MGMGHISLTCSLSHRYLLYSSVLSSYHPSVCPLYMQWMGMGHISPTCRLSHALYRPLVSSHAWCCCHLLFTIPACWRPRPAQGRYRLYSRCCCINNECMLKPFRERGQLGNDPTNITSREVMGRGSLSHRRE